MSYTNKAAWIHAIGENYKIDSAETGKPGEGQVLIKNHAVAINPVDWKMQASGYFVKAWPSIFGNDVAGEVVEVGEGVTHLKKGQRVLAHTIALITGQNDMAGFQNYTVAKADATAPIPDNVSYEDASVIPLALSTAAAGLYEEEFLGLPFPSTSPKKSGKTILIWGGSSSVGSQAIQLAVASGLDVITTASKRNFDYCKKLGAKEVFDYSSPSVVGDLTAALQNTTVVGVYDAIGENESTTQSAEVLAQLGGGSIATVLEPPKDLPATVTAKQVFAISIFLKNPQVGKAVYQEFLTSALESEQFVPAPRAKVVGHGLEHIQTACDELKKGVSATKLVVTL